MPLTTLGDNYLLDYLRTSKTLYLALFTASPGKAGGGTEVTGGAYARQPVTCGASANGVTTNTALVQFPTATVGWGTVTSWALFDAATGGNMLWYGDLSQAEPVNPGNIYQVPVGNLRLTLN